MIQEAKKIAVLIDADNTQLSALEAIMTELAKYGYIIVKRAYGDWAAPTLKNWKDPLNELAIQPIQQFSYTQGKNSSDAAMIIDAMDLLYSDKFNAFALISSDSDFTKLATRLKESQIYVYGVGKKQTPIAFINACDDFLYIDVLKSLDTEENNDPLHALPNQFTKQQLCQDAKLINTLRNAAEERSEDDGWALLSICGSFIKRQYPDFDPRNYGYAKLSTLIEATSLFDIKKDTVKGSGNIKIYYRDKKKHKI
ncbi:MAG: NYN domain-containing protein [Methylococcales bacterium]|nr:NYN domain-containing protein [Methylococcales bacterium]